MSKIVTLKDNTTSQPIYPITSTKAVIDDEGNSVDSIIQDIHQISENYIVAKETYIPDPDDTDVLEESAIRKTPQTLSETEKKQARINIDAADNTVFEKNLEKIYSNLGISNIPSYSVNIYYNTGDVVVYDNLFYEFTAEHPEGLWEPGHVKKVSVIDIILHKLINE